MNQGFEETQTVGPRSQHTSDTDLRVPDYLGPYRIIEEIASGGMGTVYLAVRKLDERVRKVVALKTIHPHLAKQTGFVQMFLDEASIAARISHPNAATIVDFGEADGRFYLAMEYLPGEPLDAILEVIKKRPELRRGPSYPLLIAHIIAETAEGLHALHELRGPDGTLLEVVHRDISPHNIMIGYDGRVTVLDFGVARSKDKVHQTETGEIRGKIAYVSPEQLHGEPADRRSDIWSLGVVLWEALCLTSLFRRNTPVDTILAVRGAKVDAISDHNALVDESLQSLVSHILSRDPMSRPATALDVASALREIARAGSGRSGLTSLMNDLFPEGKTAHRERLLRAETASIRPRGALRSKRFLWIGAAIAAVLIGSAASLFTTLDSTQRSKRTALNANASDSTTSNSSAPFSTMPSAFGTVPDASLVAVKIQDASSKLETEQAIPSDPSAEQATATKQARLAARAKRTIRRRNVRRNAATGHGTLNLVTPGGWAIVLDAKGKRLGRTPLSARLPAGRHKLTLVPFGDASKKHPLAISIKADSATRKAVPLSQ